MAEAPYRADRWDRLRLAALVGAATLLPLWVLLTVVLLEVGRDPEEVREILIYVMPDGTIEERTAGPGAGTILWTAGVAMVGVLATALVTLPMGWWMTRTRAARSGPPGPLVDPSLVEGATWEVRVRRGGEAPPEG